MQIGKEISQKVKIYHDDQGASVNQNTMTDDLGTLKVLICAEISPFLGAVPSQGCDPNGSRLS